MRETTTTDFSKFGHRERHLAEQLLHEWNNKGLPEGFEAKEVVIMFNMQSGNVFLTNSEFQVAMMNGDILETFYTDFETGEEGFANDISDEAKTRLGLK